MRKLNHTNVMPVKMKHLLSLLLIVFTSMASAMQNQQVVISGTVTDGSTGETLIGATIQVAGTTGGAVSNVYGFYSLPVNGVEVTLIYSFLGFETINMKLNLREDTVINVELSPQQFDLQEVVIRADNLEQVRSLETGVQELKVESIKHAPVLLGEVDIIRSIVALPGVSNVGEGASGFNVRGGNIDQNLILLDEAPVYNSSHLFGFFSVFNADAIKSLKLYKGYIPAKYGGRVSSTLDIRQRDGNNRKFQVSGGIGAVSSRLAVEGPIIKEKSSFLVAARHSYADLILKVADLDEVSPSFYDVNTKINFSLGEKDKLYVSGYFGKDILKLKFEDEEILSLGDGTERTVKQESKTDFSWGNNTFTVRWNHIYGQKLFSNVSAIFSNYGYDFESSDGSGPSREETGNAFQWDSNIKSYSGKADFTLFANQRNTIDFGGEATYSVFTPANVRGNEGSPTVSFSQDHVVETALYVSNEQYLWPRLAISYGVRASYFGSYGPRQENVYKDGEARTSSSITGRAIFPDGKKVETYSGIAPRLLINYSLSESSSLKASYSRLRQNFHLISNTTSSSPFDIWRPSGLYTKPQISDQVSLGYFTSLKGGEYDLSAEVYYKRLKNVVVFKDGADLFAAEAIELDLLQGEGTAYGLECYLSKNEGPLTGSLSYTFSRTERKINSAFPEKRINNGKVFPADFDKPHAVGLSATYKIGKRTSLNAAFNFYSGRPYTPVVGAYVSPIDKEPEPTLLYGDRNARRIPDYHRLDVSFTIHGKKGKSSLTFGVINLYGRKNVFSYLYSTRKIHEFTIAPQIKVQPYRFSFIGVPIPSVTYNFKW